MMPKAKGDPYFISCRQGAEEAVIFEWPNPATGEVLTLGGIPDLPTQFAGQRYIVDNKFTTQWLNDHWAKKFRLGHQFRVYCAALEATTGESYDGAYVNAIYFGPPPKSPWNRIASSPNRLFGPFHYTEGHLQETWEWAKGLTEAEALYERLEIWPQNEQACGNFGGCQYLELCERAPAVRGALAQMKFRRKEPNVFTSSVTTLA